VPRILTRRPTLNGKSDVLCFEKGPDKWFLQILVEGSKKYKTKRIPLARILEEVIEGAIDTFISLKGKPEQTLPSKPRRSSQQ